MDASLNAPLMLAGGALCAAVVGGGALGIGDRWRRQRERRRRASASREQFRQKVAYVAAEALARRAERLAWSGLRGLRVSAVVDECRGVKSFYLAAVDGRPLPAFQPGQYLTLHLPRPDGGKPIVRCYSLSDRPREEFYRITVKQAAPPAEQPDAPPGVGSTILHTAVGVGDVLQAAAPRGEFVLPPHGDEPVVLIGAGVGVTPLVSMVAAQAHAGSVRETYLLIGMRDGREHPFKQALADLVADQPNVHPFVAYSRPTHRDAEHRDYQHRGHIDLDFVRGVLPSSNFRFYLCGPPAMLESLVPALLDWGVPPERIAFEAFGAASVARVATESPGKQAVGAAVRFVRSGVQAEWTTADRSLLDLAERLGVPMDAGCRVGNCGACATRVLEGGVAAVKQPGAAPGNGECLACVSVPTGSIVLEA